jgi:hypothetical protein
MWVAALYHDMILPEIVFEWLILLLRIRDVQGSNLGPLTGYPY